MAKLCGLCLRIGRGSIPDPKRHLLTALKVGLPGGPYRRAYSPAAPAGGARRESGSARFAVGVVGSCLGRGGTQQGKQRM